MMSSFNIAPVTVVMLTLLATSTGDHHEEDYQWDIDILYSETANLTCSDGHFLPEKHIGASYQWMLPSGDIIDEASVVYDNHFTLSNHGSNLLIHHVDKPDFGIYYCLVMTDPLSIHAVVKLGVNADGPFYGDPWERYTPKIKIGLLAGAAVFVIMSMFCYNYDSFQERHDKPALNQSFHNISLHAFYSESGNVTHTNPAFIEDEMEEKKDEKVDGDPEKQEKLDITPENETGQKVIN